MVREFYLITLILSKSELIRAVSEKKKRSRDFHRNSLIIKVVVGEGLPCGFASAKSSRTSLRAVEPDVSTPRHFMPYTACAVISSPHCKKKAPRSRCIVFEMVVGDGNASSIKLRSKIAVTWNFSAETV